MGGVDEDSLSEGLRARKKRLMRQLISDTATEMMLEHGFDDVRVADVAEAVGVSEKTVYNYFPTKESLLLDREEEMAAAIREALGPGSPHRSPVEAVVEIIRRDLDDLRVRSEQGMGGDVALFQRFYQIVEETPSLRAAQGDMMGRLVRVAAETLAARAGVSPEDPEPQIAADALLGLWRIQYMALSRHATEGRSFPEVCQAAGDEVDRAARLIDSGLWSFAVMVGGNGGKEQLRAAAEAAQAAGRQVAAALRQARTAWTEMQAMHDARHQAQPAGWYGTGTKRQVAEEVKRRIRDEMRAQIDEQVAEQRRLAEERHRSAREARRRR